MATTTKAKAVKAAGKTAAEAARATTTAKSATGKATRSGVVKAAKAARSGTPADHPASVLIDERIAALGDWRGQTLRRVRQWIHEAVPAVIEEWKWMGTPVWSCGGILCTGESYQGKVKLTFAKGASLADPAGLFNASLDGNTRRAIDLHEGETLDAAAFKTLIQAAAANNAATGKARVKRRL